jgi:CheY-like chemotaxis protein
VSAATGHFSQPRRSALIVDDSSLACAVLSRLLEQEGFDSELAGSGEEAIERARARRPDVVFMDHLMPGMTGLDAVRALKSDARTAAVPVVMFSSLEDEAFLTDAREAGALTVLTKHTERSNLRNVLAQLGPAPAAPAITVRGPPPAAAAQPAGLTPEDLRVAIGPLLSEQRDRIREELLAELAILESHQESMRRALTGKLEAVLRRTLREVSEEFSARLPAPAEPSFPGLLARSGAVAAALALLMVPIGLMAEQGRRLDAVVAGGAELRAAVDSQSHALAALGQQVEDLGRQVAATSASLQRAADAGPVELRSAQGAFCLEPAGSGYRLVPAGRGGGCASPEAIAVMASTGAAARTDRSY